MVVVGLHYCLRYDLVDYLSAHCLPCGSIVGYLHGAGIQSTLDKYAYLGSRHWKSFVFRAEVERLDLVTMVFRQPQQLWVLRVFFFLTVVVGQSTRE